MFDHDMHRERQGNPNAPGATNPAWAGFGPLGVIAHVLSMGRNSDAVYSQEELDRVISELIDRNVNGNAPPPASEAAIESLPQKKVDESMMGNEGKAECSICMDSVELKEEVTVLPCSHWFHGPCITVWLREHNTCPHCRRSITSAEDERRSQQEASRSPQPMPEGLGTRSNPFVLPDSPPRTHSGGDANTSSSNGSSQSRRASGQTSSGGLAGWVRNRFGSSDPAWILPDKRFLGLIIWGLGHRRWICAVTNSLDPFFPFWSSGPTFSYTV